MLCFIILSVIIFDVLMVRVFTLSILWIRIIMPSVIMQNVMVPESGPHTMWLRHDRVSRAEIRTN
jgi:hypothetical protein